MVFFGIQRGKGLVREIDSAPEGEVSETAADCVHRLFQFFLALDGGDLREEGKL